MKTLATMALWGSLALTASTAAADWPSLFSGTSKSSTSTDTTKSFWASERPSFGSPVPKKPEAPAPRKPPVIFQKVGAMNRKAYDVTLGRVIPRAKPAPISVTGRHTPWTRNKPVETEKSSWFSPRSSEPAATTSDFFKLKRPG